MKNLDIYCVTNKKLEFLERTPLKLVGVGNEKFSEKYLRWLYEPILQLFGREWNTNNLDLIIVLHWILNLILMWYYCFYIYIKK